jgi:hypothetical protein
MAPAGDYEIQAGTSSRRIMARSSFSLPQKQVVEKVTKDMLKPQQKIEML